MSWLSSIGSIIGKVLKVVAADGEKTLALVKPVAAALLPQFAPEINVAGNIATNILNEVVSVEGVAAAAGTATGTGAAKLQSVLTNVGPAIDTWIAANFPGATTISAASKAGLVNAIVAIANEVAAPAVPGPIATPTS